MAGFLDKVVVGINKGVNTVSEGSKILVEKAKINTQIQDVEREKSKLLQNMGTLIFNLHMNGEIQIEQCVGICTEIASYNNQITELQQQLQNLDAGKQQSVQYTQSVQPIENGITCECGFTNKPEAKFCSHCGKTLN